MTAKTYVRYGREVLYDDPEWIPVPMKRQVLARIYEIRGILNGIAVIEHEMTAAPCGRVSDAAGSCAIAHASSGWANSRKLWNMFSFLKSPRQISSYVRKPA